ncbi:MAG: cytochrome c oxidase, subunit [Actinomycetia bacterium]|nr:cytochrome c oxidase, subunit [Actinomycetes bacterium]
MFDRIRRVIRRGPVAVGATTLAVLLAGCAKQAPDKQQNALRPDGPAAHKILQLTTPFFWLAVVIGIGVVGATIVLAIKFRERPGEERNPKQIHGHSALEISWTIIPALILAVMGVFTVSTIFDLSKEPKGANVVHINVTGKQWWWEYDYTDASGTKLQFTTANEMHIPVNTPVFLRITAADVIHSFWVPNLAGKKDAVPGRTDYLTIQGSKIGEFAGTCAEYCGLSHANMHLKVFVQTRADYDAWVATQKTTPPKLASYVKDQTGPVAGYACTSCHAFAGSGAGSAATRGPNLSHLGDRTTFAGGTYDLTLDNLTKWIYDAPSRKPMEQGPDPKNPRVGMPNFSKLGMTESQARDIATSLLCDTASNPSKFTGLTCP